MTETSVEIVFDGTASDLMTNIILETGTTIYTIKDEQYAQAIFDTFFPEVQITAVELMDNSTIIEAAKKELKERLDGETYVSRILEGVQPTKH